MKVIRCVDSWRASPRRGFTGSRSPVTENFRGDNTITALLEDLAGIGVISLIFKLSEELFGEYMVLGFGRGSKDKRLTEREMGTSMITAEINLY